MKKLSGYNVWKMKINVIASMIVHFKIIWMVECDLQPQLTTVQEHGVFYHQTWCKNPGRRESNANFKTISSLSLPQRNEVQCYTKKLRKIGQSFDLRLFLWPLSTNN